MENLIRSVELSLDHKNWYSALTLALILPDIAGKIEFANREFKDLYFEVVKRFNQNPEAKAESFINDFEPGMASSVTNIIMEEERYILHDWERMDIYVKNKDQTISQIVSQTLLNLRKNLIHSKINDLMNSPRKDGVYIDETIMETVNDYRLLNNLLGDKLNRVL